MKEPLKSPMIDSTSFQKYNHNNEIEKNVLHNSMHSYLIPMSDVKIIAHSSKIMFEFPLPRQLKIQFFGIIKSSGYL